MFKLFSNLLREEHGPTAVEYAVMLAGIVAVCIATVLVMSNATADSFQNSADELDGVLG